MISEPYIKNRISSIVDTSKNKTRVNLGFVRKQHTYVTFPALNINNTWRGASEIIAKLNFSLGYNNSFVHLYTIPPAANINYCACVSWKPTSNTIVRYKLWKNVGELLYVEDYAGQRINKDFSIEIWNTNHPIILGDSFRINTSQLVIPTDFCDQSDVQLTNIYRNCTDIIFNYTNFDPTSGDYYSVVGDCGEADLIKAPKLTADFITLQSTDGTWHKVNFKIVGGDVYFFVNQVNEAASLTPFLPMAYGSSVYSFALSAINDPILGLTHQWYITGPLANIADYGLFYGQVLLLADDLTQHAFRINQLGGNLAPQILT